MKIICIKNCYTDKYHPKGEELEIQDNKKVPVHFEEIKKEEPKKVSMGDLNV